MQEQLRGSVVNARCSMHECYSGSDPVCAVAGDRATIACRTPQYMYKRDQASATHPLLALCNENSRSTVRVDWIVARGSCRRRCPNQRLNGSSEKRPRKNIGLHCMGSKDRSVVD